MHDTEKTVARALKWLETAQDEEEIEDVQRLIERIARQPDSTRVAVWVEALCQFIKGTRLTVTLNGDQENAVVQFATVMNNIFTELPDLTVPRDRSIESLVEKLTDAFISKIKAESK